MLDCKYSFKQEIKITKGFYKGFKGVIHEVKQDKNGVILYLVHFENKKEWLPENMLTKTFSNPFKI